MDSHEAKPRRVIKLRFQYDYGLWCALGFIADGNGFTIYLPFLAFGITIRRYWR